jgi:hypothetical protein
VSVDRGEVKYGGWNMRVQIEIATTGWFRIYSELQNMVASNACSHAVVPSCRRAVVQSCSDTYSTCSISSR